MKLNNKDLDEVRCVLDGFLERQDRDEDMEEDVTLLQYLPTYPPTQHLVLDNIAQCVFNRKRWSASSSLVPST